MAIAVTITKSGPYVDYAVALRESVRSNFQHSRYHMEYVAFVYAGVEHLDSCVERLGLIGYKVMVKDFPIKWEDLPEGDYKAKVRNAGGGLGLAELLKLYAYTMLEFHRVVIMDLDLVVAQNFDEVFDLDSTSLSAVVVWGNWDVEMVQAGFICVKPSLEVFEELLEIIRSATFRFDGSGWNNSHWGNTWGGETVSGVLPYYYRMKRPAGMVHINSCIYNTQLVEACATTGVELVKIVHFTGCEKPRMCKKNSNVRCEWAHDLWWRYLWQWQDRVGSEKTPRCVEGADRSQGNYHYHGKYLDLSKLKKPGP